MTKRNPMTTKDDELIIDIQNVEFAEALAQDRNRKANLAAQEVPSEEPASPDNYTETILVRACEIDELFQLKLFIRKPNRPPQLPHPLVLRFHLRSLGLTPSVTENSYLHNLEFLIRYYENKFT